MDPRIEHARLMNRRSFMRVGTGGIGLAGCGRYSATISRSRGPEPPRSGVWRAFRTLRPGQNGSSTFTCLGHLRILICGITSRC